MKTMTEQYTPTTEEVLGMLGSYLYEYGAGCDMNLPGNSPDEIVDRWLAKRDAEVAAKAWDRGFDAGWAECSDPGAFVNDVWDAKTPNPYGLTAEQEG